jgi:short-subunit dehydrogenase
LESHVVTSAIVVGSSAGIGAAIAAALRRQGHTVWGLARRSSGGAVDFSLPCDVSLPEELEAALREALEKGGAPSRFVYASGAAIMGKSLEAPTESARRVFEVNFWGMERAIRLVYPAMARRRQGSILAVLSLAALRAVPFEAHYAASKAACARYLECFAHEASNEGVRVSYIAPGYVETGFLQRADWFGMPPVTVRGSGVTPDEVASAALALMDGRRRSPIIGWREKAIAIADRVLPGAYDELLRLRRRR